jgi:hypothetical protein
MKIFRISNQTSKTITIGNIGSFGSLNDQNRLYMVDDWLFRNDPEYVDGASYSHDNVDLNHGRDFLRESKSYNVIVLHDIYNPVDDVDRQKGGIFSVSPHHGPGQWVQKLAASGADYIFVFGSWGEIGGWWLGEIPGYDTIRGRNEYKTVYRNQKLPPVNIEEEKPIDWENFDISWLGNPENPEKKD